MRLLHPLAPALACVLYFTLSCSATSTAPLVEPDPDVELEALLAQTPAASTDVREHDRAGTLDRLTRFALRRAGEDRGPEVVERIVHHLHGLQSEVRRAREVGDELAVREAVERLATAKAQVVIHVLGPRVTHRVLHHAAERIRRIQGRIEAAAGTDRDVSRARRIVSAASDLVRRAHGALSSGDAVTALRLGAQALNVLRRID